MAINSGKAQANLVGTWKGTSICQVKNSPCHDEIVVYHISKGEGVDSFTVRADKIVNGVEEDMGILHCKFESKTKQLTSNSYRSNWVFTLKDKTIDGTLYVQGTLYRIIKVTKQD